MTTVSQVTQAVYEGVFKNSVSQGADAAAKSMGGLGDEVEATDTKVRRAAGSWDSYVAKAADATGVARQLKGAELDLALAAVARDKAVAQGKITLDSSVATMAALSGRVATLQEKYAAMTQATVAANDATLKLYATMTAIADKTQQVAGIQQKFNDLLGVKASTQDDYTKRAADVAAYGNSLDAVRAKFNPLFAVSKQYENILNEISNAQKVGALSAQEAQAATERATKEFAAVNAPLGAVTTSSGNAAFAMRQLGVQSIQAFSGIATGQSVMQVFIQQGHQVADVALSTGTGLSVFGAAWRAITSPIGLAIAGIVAVGGAMAAVAVHAITLSAETRQLNTAIAAVGRSADISATAVQKLVSASLATGLSRAEADTIAGAAIRNPQISQGQIGQILNQATNLATATGQSPADAMKDYMAAVAGSAAAVLKLDTQLNFLSAAQRQAVHDNGDLSTAIDLLNARINHLHDDSLSNLEKLWNQIKVAADSALGGIVAGLNGVITATSKISSFETGTQLSGDNSALAGPLDGGVTKEFADAQAKSNPLLDAANKKVQDLTQSSRDLQTVLRAGITQRSTIQAGIDADNKTRDEELSVDDKLIVKRAAMSAAAAQAADAGVQETAAQQRAIASGLLIAGTYDQSRAATLTATAATQAHEKAVTTAGIAEVGYAQALLNRGAAEAAAAGSGTIQNLQQQLDITNRLSAAEGLSSRAAHYTQLSTAVDQATKELEAQRDVATDPRIIDNLTAQIAKVRELMFAQDAATNDRINNAANNVSQDQLTVLQKQGELIGQNATATARQVAELQTLLQLEREEGADPAKLTESQQKRIELTGAIAAQNEALQEQKSALQEVAGLFTSAFDQISQGITNSLLQGTGAAVNWKNVMTSVAQQVLSAFLKLAILNPLLNGLLGQNLATLGSVGGLLGGIGGAAGGVGGTGGGGGLLSLLGLGSQGAQATGLFGGLGITGSVNSLASDIAPSLFSSPGDVVGNAMFGAPIGQGALGAFTDFAGGAGLGFGAGSLAGGFVQHSLGKVGPAPTIGAGVGALGGALAGTLLFPGVGTLLGGLLGGVLGGGAGGLIGPKAPSPFSSTGVSIQNGQLAVGGTLSQRVDATGERSATQANAAQLNSVLAANNLALVSLGTTTQIGQNTLGSFQDPSKKASIGDAFSQFRFSSQDSHVNAYLQSGAGFENPDQLNAVVATIQNFVNAVSGTDFAPKIDDIMKSLVGIGNAGIPDYLAGVQAFVTQTVPALEKFGAVSGSYTDAVNAINEQFAPAIAMAQKLGYAEADLTAARDKASAALLQQERDAAAEQEGGLQGRYLTALGAVTGNVADQQNAALFNFDQQATQQRTALVTQYKGILGDTYAASYEYQMNSVALEKALGEERLAVQAQFNDQSAQQAAVAAAQQVQQAAAAAAQLAQQRDQATQDAAGLITSLTSYAQGLQTGSASDLSPQAQYALAKRQFNAVSGAAAAGDVSSIQQLQQYSDSFLNASRNVNGSGAGYASDFSNVIGTLRSVASIAPSTLSQNVFVSETRTQTQVLVTNLQLLQTAISGLQTAVTQAAGRPQRLVA